MIRPRIGISRRFFFFAAAIFGFQILFSGCLPEKRISSIEPLNLTPFAETVTVEYETAHPPTVTASALPTATQTPDISLTPPAMPTHPALRAESIPTLRADEITHEVVSGDTITNLSDIWQVSKNAIAQTNNIRDLDSIYIGQELIIPAQVPDFQDQGARILSDAQMVFGPDSSGFNSADFLQEYPDSYLNTFMEPTPTAIPDSKEGQPVLTPRSAAQIIDKVAIENSINPKVLIALLEFQSQTLSGKKPGKLQNGYVITDLGPAYKSFSSQLSWAADELNYGFYHWKNHQTNLLILDDDAVVQVDPEINAGTAALQYLFSKIYDRQNWIYAVSENGFAALYRNLFGDSAENYDATLQIPEQPELSLPFATGEIWSFTSGPHYGWASGSPWAALDFAPPDAVACSESDYWVTAAADGNILYSDNGLVLQELDDDHDPRTGWLILYLHIRSDGRIEIADNVRQGTAIGHPSCEGGVANGTHIHIARRYNGEWVPADGLTPFVLSGWEAYSTGKVYDGYLVNHEKIVEAWYYKTTENEISH